MHSKVPNLSGGLNYHKNIPFSTFDKLNCPQRCIDIFEGGWWYVNCALIFLNGVYRPNPTKEFSGNYNIIGTTSIYCENGRGRSTLTKSCMMFRPKDDNRPCNNPCKNNGTCKYVAAKS